MRRRLGCDIRQAAQSYAGMQHVSPPKPWSDAGTIEGVIDDGCTRAYGFDEADTVTVLEAVRHQY